MVNRAKSPRRLALKTLTGDGCADSATDVAWPISTSFSSLLLLSSSMMVEGTAECRDSSDESADESEDRVEVVFRSVNIGGGGDGVIRRSTSGSISHT